MTTSTRSFLVRLLGCEPTREQILFLAHSPFSAGYEAWNRLLRMAHTLPLEEVIEFLRERRMTGGGYVSSETKEFIVAVEGRGKPVVFWMAIMSAFPITKRFTEFIFEKIKSRATPGQLREIVRDLPNVTIRREAWLELRSRTPSARLLTAIIRENQFLRVDALYTYRDLGYDPKPLAKFKKLPGLSQEIGRMLKSGPMAQAQQ